MDFTNTQTLLAAVNQLQPATSFLRDRYFPTNESTDIFNTEEVLVEYRDGNKKLAPYVSPRKNGVTMLRDGYSMRSFAPANIAPKRPMYVDDLKRKGFGEALFSNLSPEARQMALMMQDLTDLDCMITRREELMAAETMLNNGCVMKHIADHGDEYEEKEIRFYTEDENPAEYTCPVDWDDSNANIIEDVYQMILLLTSKGNAATEVLLGKNVVNNFINNAKIQKLLDLKHVNIGDIEPMMLPTGAARIARLNIRGHMIDFLTYEATYENESGVDTPYIPNNKIVLTAPNAGRTAYGAVTQVEQFDGLMHSYPGRRVPHYVSNADNNSRNITLTSRPLLMPNRKNPWISATVLSD